MNRYLDYQPMSINYRSQCIITFKGKFQYSFKCKGPLD